MYTSILLDAAGGFLIGGIFITLTVLAIIALILLIYFFNKARKRKKK